MRAYISWLYNRETINQENGGTRDGSTVRGGIGVDRDATTEYLIAKTETDSIIYSEHTCKEQRVHTGFTCLLSGDIHYSVRITKLLAVETACINSFEPTVYLPFFPGGNVQGSVSPLFFSQDNSESIENGSVCRRNRSLFRIESATTFVVSLLLANNFKVENINWYEVTRSTPPPVLIGSTPRILHAKVL